MTLVDLRVPAIDDYKGTVCRSSPDPHWSVDSLRTQLDFIENHLRSTSPYPLELKIGSLVSPPRPTPPPASPVVAEKDKHGADREEPSAESWRKTFVMRVPVDDEDESGSDSEESPSRELMVAGTRFSCTDLYLSESDYSDDDLVVEIADGSLMRKTCIVEGLLLELEHEKQLKVEEEIRKKLSKQEVLGREEYEKSVVAFHKIDKDVEARRAMYRQSDILYKHKIAEERDHHLAFLQRNHAQKFQAEELKLKKDAAFEEAKRKERTLQEERIRTEKAREEAARAEAARAEAARAEEARKAALDAERRALKEAADKAMPIGEISSTGGSASPQVDSQERKTGPAGIKVKAASNAIKAEEMRLLKYRVLVEKNAQFALKYSKEIDSCERQINKRIRQITWTIENVRDKASELIKIIKDPRYPHSVSLMIFAKKVVGLCENPSGSFQGIAFACGHIILLVASQLPEFPDMMDIILCEFHSACVYTVPKHLQASEEIAKTKDFWKLIGYREENGQIETSDKYLRRVEACMKLYGALVQTEISGIQNPLGLKEGWAWLARFLNELPATAATATALHSFLKMTGFSLFQKYKSQFRKILVVISDSFLPALKSLQNPRHGSIISSLELYIDKREFLNEPEGRQLRTHLSSRDYV